MPAQANLAAIADPRHLPTPPAAAMELLRLSRDPDAGLGEMAEVLALDGGLAARIIATANSAIYRREREATTIERAIGQIGVRSVVTVALGHSVTSQLPRDGRIAGLDLARYWKNSLMTAVSTRDLCPGRADEGFLVGLVANIGKIAMGRSLGSTYSTVVEAADGWPSPALERESLGVSSLDVTAEALRAWSLPEIFVDAVARAADPERAVDEDAAALGRALRVGMEIAAFASGATGGAGLEAVRATAGQAGFEAEAVEELIRGLGPAMAEAAEALAMGIDSDDYDAVLDEAREQLVEMSLQADMERQRESAKVAELERSNRELEERALTDGLTGLSNRVAFDQAIEQQIRLRLREPESFAKPLGVAMIDIDHFKSVNDTHGHPVGDEVLKQLGLVLQMMSRTEEVAARYGGEEFVLLAPLARPEDLRVACERIRRAIELIEVETPSGPLTITASLGAACIEAVTSLDDAARVLEAADAKLYEAKGNGRNETRVLDEVLTGS